MKSRPLQQESNFEINERNVVVTGEFANKLPSSDPNSRFVTKVEVVGDVNFSRTEWARIQCSRYV